MIAKAAADNDLDRFDRIAIKTPCQMDWYKMEGNERVRFCDLCQRHVYNLVHLSKPEIDKIWKNEPERVCARMIKDTDGRLVTKEWKALPKFRRFQFSTWFLFVLMTCAAPLAAASPAAYRMTKGYLQDWFGSTAMTVNPVPMMGDVEMSGACTPAPEIVPGL